MLQSLPTRSCYEADSRHCGNSRGSTEPAHVRRGNVNANNARATPATAPAGQQKWQPDQSRLRTGGASASAGTREARGWSAGAAQPATGAATARPAAGTLAAGSAPSARPAAAAAPSRPASSPNASPPRTSTAGSRSTPADSAFSGVYGYFFKILPRQGRHAIGGKYEYNINGNMIGGFALVAWPAVYGQSGIMTFIVNQQGRVYQKDLGPQTTKLAQRMKEYDPAPAWQVSPD